jgi:hypothetical protein
LRVESKASVAITRIEYIHPMQQIGFFSHRSNKLVIPLVTSRIAVVNQNDLSSVAVACPYSGIKTSIGQGSLMDAEVTQESESS